MQIIAVGLNHKKAPLEIREKMAFSDEQVPSAISSLRQGGDIAEAVIISTCNRVELYVAGDNLQVSSIENFIANFHNIDKDRFKPFLYIHKDVDAVRHLFNVASSLDSMVVGETQIINQVKDAYLTAKEYGHTSKVLNQLFQHSLNVAKLIHSVTAIGEKHTSIPTVAAKLAEKIFENLSAKKLLIVGAGEIGRVTLHAFKVRGVADISVCNRTVEKADELVKRFGGRAYSFQELNGLIAKVDIVITCIDYGDVLMPAKQISDCMAIRKNAPLFLIDLAVPRNISPDVGNIENVYLFNIDDLQSIVNQNLEEREKEIKKCEPLIENEVTKFITGLSSYDINPLLKDIRDSFYTVGKEELKESLAKLQDIDEKGREEVSYLVKRVINRLLHNPTTALKDEVLNGEKQSVIKLARKLFGINK